MPAARLVRFLSLSDLFNFPPTPKKPKPTTTALDLLVSKRITGLPVVDDKGVVVRIFFLGGGVDGWFVFLLSTGFFAPPADPFSSP